MDIGSTLHMYIWLHGFLVRWWWKATKPSKIAGPLFLAKKCLPEESWQLGWFSLDMKARQHLAVQRGVTRENAKIKTTKKKYSIFMKCCTCGNFLLYSIFSSHAHIPHFPHMHLTLLSWYPLLSSPLPFHPSATEYHQHSASGIHG